ncbi:MAG: azurin, partial [Rhodanobacter sp.]
MQYNVSSIVVPASCTDFKITLKHTGKMPVTAMGHDVVIAKEADMKAVDASASAASRSSRVRRRTTIVAV